MGKRKIYIILQMTLGLFFLLSCSPKTEKSIGDGGFISGVPCSAPCFYNITPDFTTRRDLLQIIDNEKVLSYCQEYNFLSSGGSSGLRCSNFSVSLENDVVSGVEFLPSTILSVEDVLTEYGEPSSVVVTEENLPEEPLQLSMILSYETKCVEVVTEPKQGKSYIINHDTKIYKIIYLGRSICVRRQENLLKYVEQWAGFKSYELITP